MMEATENEDRLVRLDKLLAERGAGSRKDVDRMIRKGLVEVDGEIVGKSAAKLKVPWSSSPIADGFDYPPPPMLAAYHKPLGVVSTMRDDRGRSDLSSVLPLSWQKSLHPVGRLDADTTGLLLFSRDGELTHRLLHPKYLVEREYLAEVEGPIDRAVLTRKLADGVETVEEGESLVVCATLLDVSDQTVRLTVTEGKYRMVRRILANCGHPVVSLHRVRYGDVWLDEAACYEGEAVPVEGEALQWALSLTAAPAPASPTRAAEEHADGEVSAGKGTRSQRQAKAEEHASPQERDLEAEMTEAAWREWHPPESVLEAVADEASVSREDALGALRRYEGDVVSALQELMS